MVTVMTKSTDRGIHDKDSSSEEPCEVKVSRTVLEWRGGRATVLPTITFF
jgi:hypothetical protein